MAGVRGLLLFIGSLGVACGLSMANKKTKVTAFKDDHAVDDEANKFLSQQAPPWHGRPNVVAPSYVLTRSGKCKISDQRRDIIRDKMLCQKASDAFMQLFEENDKPIEEVSNNEKGLPMVTWEQKLKPPGCFVEFGPVRPFRVKYNIDLDSAGSCFQYNSGGRLEGVDACLCFGDDDDVAHIVETVVQKVYNNITLPGPSECEASCNEAYWWSRSACKKGCQFAYDGS